MKKVLILKELLNRSKCVKLKANEFFNDAMKNIMHGKYNRNDGKMYEKNKAMA